MFVSLGVAINSRFAGLLVIARDEEFRLWPAKRRRAAWPRS